ncbi:MAG: Rrf2 family transcriptional regulator [Bacillota bacterium]
MKISTRGQYGVLAMTVLARHYGRDPVSIKEIAEEKNLPASYLEHLLAPLRRAGLVRSVRGPRGGYQLASPPEDITVGDVLVVLEGPFVPVECAGEDLPCGEQQCSLRRVWQDLRESMIQVVDSVTLRELTEDVGSRCCSHR